MRKLDRKLFRDLLRMKMQLAAVGGVLAFVEARKGKLRLVAVDARTGRTRWSSMVSTGLVGYGASPWIVVSGRTIVYPAPGSDEQETIRVAAIDPAASMSEEEILAQLVDLARKHPQIIRKLQAQIGPNGAVQTGKDDDHEVSKVA